MDQGLSLRIGNFKIRYFFKMRRDSPLRIIILKYKLIRRSTKFTAVVDTRTQLLKLVPRYSCTSTVLLLVPKIST